MIGVNKGDPKIAFNDRFSYWSMYQFCMPIEATDIDLQFHVFLSCDFDPNSFKPRLNGSKAVMPLVLNKEKSSTGEFGIKVEQEVPMLDQR